MGGAQVALGGDLSSALSNPAGLGFYNRSEFSFSPSLNFANSDSEFLGTITSDSKANFNFSNIGAVINKGQSDLGERGFKGGSFGISLTKTADFNNRVTYETNNPTTDLFDVILTDLNDGFDTNLTDMAFNAFLVDQFPVVDANQDTSFVFGYIDSFYTQLNPDSIVIVPVFPILQTETITTRGAQYQLSLSYGANFNDKVYLGASIGMVALNYREQRAYREFRDDGVLDDFTVRDDVDITGSGVNLTLGAIIRPIDQLTLGVSFISPTFYNLEEVYAGSIVANFNNYVYSPELTLTQEIAESDIFLSNYSLRTPWKINGGLAYFFGKNGFITADVEWVDYTKNHLNSNDFSTTGDNRTINSLYKSVLNYRAGAEYRYDIFRFRGGYAFTADPYEGDGIDRSISSISFGGGIRLKNFYVDLGFVNSWNKSTASPYTLVDGTGPVANIDNNIFSAVTTVGFNF